LTLAAPVDAATASNEAQVAALAKELQLSLTVAGWLSQNGYADAARARRFFQPRLSDLNAPDGMLGRAVAAKRLARAVRSRESIVVFGDYDCDGMTATAILTEVLRELGGQVTPLLANRFAGGYGVSLRASERIRALQPKVLVTCDCGSSDHDTLQLLSDQGIDVIVIDHHLVPDRPLPALAFLNPHRPECAFPYKGLASCGLAMSVGAAVRSELGVDLDMRRWLDLVAIGTIADVAPLTDDNRALVRTGLLRVGQAERPGLKALLEVARIDRGSAVDARDVAFKLAPRLNAPGRLGAPDLALQLLIARDDVQAATLAEQLEDASQERRRVQQQILEQAISMIEEGNQQQRAAIVVGQPDWNPGIVGIVAGRLAERYACPVVVCGVEGGTARGSVRGPRGFRLHDALSEVQHLLVRFGGHQAAAGLEVLPERLTELREAFVAACERAPRAALELGGNTATVLHPADELHRVVKDLDLLEPCGEGNPRPVFALAAVVADARSVKGGHLKLDLDLGKRGRLGCFRADEGDRANALRGAQVRAIGDLRRSSYWGSGGIELVASQLVVQG
jgi:single-stranded-DNA-specific exonuclease